MFNSLIVHVLIFVSPQIVHEAVLPDITKMGQPYV